MTRRIFGDHNLEAIVLAENVISPINTRQIHPSRGEKYSKNLFWWLMAKSARVQRSYVYRDSCGAHWLGYLDGENFVGGQLKEVIEKGLALPGQVHQPQGLVLVPDFWSRYGDHGVLVSEIAGS